MEPVMDGSRDFMDDALNRSIGRVGEFDHPRFGRVREVALPLRVSDTRMPVHRRAPEFGEHTEQILLWAGYVPTQIATLRSCQAIR